MKINDLMDMTLREVLENFVTVHNLECGYYYGVFRAEDIDEIFQNYNVEEDYPEAFCVENLIDDEIIVSHDDEVRSYKTLVTIMENLGISKK